MTDNLDGTSLDKDRIEIRAVIEAEVQAWVARDIDSLKGCWIRDEHSQHLTARITTGARLIHGFEAMEAHFTAAFQELTSQPLKSEPVRCENWRFSIGTDMAWVTLDQVNIPEGTGPGRLNQMKVLEKVDGAWKIAATFGIPHRIGYYKNPWVQINRNAKVIEKSAGLDEVLKTHPSLKLVGERLCGRSNIDNEKLRSALITADDLNIRLKMRAPVPIMFNGLDEDQVSLCWITIADMTIVVLVGDDALMTEAIEVGGEVYQLSPAQLRVAQEIARGNDLNKIAEILSVQPSTIRTHVRRMFQRVNVHSQAALIRALMSVKYPS